ncbi:hypothetical protein [Pseudohoeflea coraliihabitans]|uniref:Twin-arginine translocation pathway signal n=1 Tax=Pseudohoeflea coraliihabitans TaxID=2860393 RepID=A0ABS6WJY1_9HYPH|nr:hypothetical protein [Pseudohoeflea sp. DP4N28-3]MBW3096251.1 hypothetical protein [Pseudohoeflea sp. DP4N28-3]
MATLDTITRRTLLRGAPLAALVPSTPMSDMARAIAWHRQSLKEFSANCWRSDELDPRYASDTPENNERIFATALKREEETLADLLQLPAHDATAMSAKGAYLLAYLERDGLEERHVKLLLKSMIA